jgi:chromosome segregation ATPase
MTEKGNLEERVTALESEMGELKHRLQRSEKDAAAARVLAGGADRDTSELRIELREFREQNMRLHNATRADIADLRGDSTEIRGELAEVRGDIAEILGELGQLNGRVDTLTLEMRSKFDMLTAGQQQIVNLITLALDGKSGDQ